MADSGKGEVLLGEVAKTGMEKREKKGLRERGCVVEKKGREGEG